MCNVNTCKNACIKKKIIKMKKRKKAKKNSSKNFLTSQSETHSLLSYSIHTCYCKTNANDDNWQCLSQYYCNNDII